MSDIDHARAQHLAEVIALHLTAALKELHGANALLRKYADDDECYTVPNAVLDAYLYDAGATDGGGIVNYCMTVAEDIRARFAVVQQPHVRFDLIKK